MERGDRLVRQWRLLHILGARGGRTLPELMREAKCSRRTVRRDLSVLQAAGFPLTSEQDGRESRYRLTESSRAAPPIPFTLTELMSLHLGRHLLVPLRGTPVGEAIHSALEKVSATLDPSAKAFIASLNQAISARTVQAKDSSRALETLRLLQQALQERRTVEAPPQFDLDRYLEGSFGLSRGEPVRVALRFTRHVARDVAERTWHPSQAMSPLLTGELEMILKVPLGPELRRWLLGYGRDVEVLEPKTLREEIRREWLAALRGAAGRVEPFHLTPKRSGARLRRPALAPARKLHPKR